MWNLPNSLTLARLLSLPFIAGLMFLSDDWAIWTVFILFTFGAITDWLDGFIARKYNLITTFGTFLDPIADKVFVSVIMVMLIVNDTLGGLAATCIIIILSREFLVSGLREFLGPRGIQLPVTTLAKWKTATQMISLGLLLLPSDLFYYIPHMIGGALLAVATILTVITGYIYIKGSWTHLRE